ncbi:RDD family protein [Psychrobacter sp. T6-6]|uniref:RDD family protein n=1 Tax=Psychrobacter sp. T6-6 TaxID=3457452 RepID=UPI003FD31AAF
MQAIMQIFLARNNVQAGPYDLEQLNIMLASGEVLLDDLMWHEGLSQWQRVGNLTNNQAAYRPTASGRSENNDSIINNVTVFPEDNANSASGQEDKSVSLDRLYGKPERPKSVKADMTTNRHQTPHNNVSLNKSNLKKTAADKTVGNVVLAPIMSRVLATALNGLLYVLAILPLVMALTKLDVDYTKFQNIQDMDAAYQYSMSLMESLPSSTLMMSQVMVFGLFALQLLFIAMRGQSLGKLITGIRVVDQTTHRLPSFIKLIGTRTLLLFIIYNLLFSFTSFLGFVIIAIHYYMASRNPQNIGWHDKLAKTLVVKADSSQLEKKSKTK